MQRGCNHFNNSDLQYAQQTLINLLTKLLKSAIETPCRQGFEGSNGKPMKTKGQIGGEDECLLVEHGVIDSCDM